MNRFVGFIPSRVFLSFLQFVDRTHLRANQTKGEYGIRARIGAGS